MPTFSTPDPITLNFDVAVGHIRITASRRNDTVVEVFPSNSAREVDVRVAEQTRVEFAGGRLQIKTPNSAASASSGRQDLWTSPFSFPPARNSKALLQLPASVAKALSDEHG